jgi:histidyl-tRNA synthetase
MAKSGSLAAVKGFRDVLPDESRRWHVLEDAAATLFGRYGFGEIRLPVLERTELFARSLGETTDVVQKEMYTFADRDETSVTLRPEATASVVRAYLQQGLAQSDPAARLWYRGPMFRRERPQKGRYRQFHQVGAEALGMPGPDVDAELILMCARLWDDLGLDGIKLHLNSLGSLEERRAHREALVAYLKRHEADLDDDSRRRLATNPLRVLDTKNPALQSIVAGSPRLLDYLGEASLKHFDGVQAVLRDAAIPYTIDHRLVRGLDYYNLTVFEWITDRLGAQGTVCGGGRYDGLFVQLGGKPSTAAGFAMGAERLIALVREAEQVRESANCDAYLVHQGEAADRFAFTVAERLRDHGFAVLQHAGGGSFKAQMKRADASGADVAVIVGDDEAAAGEASVKPLRDDRGQVRVPLDRLPAVLTDMIYADDPPT